MVLPQPEGPSSAKNSPARMSSETLIDRAKIAEFFRDALDAQQRHVGLGLRLDPGRRGLRLDLGRLGLAGSAATGSDFTGSRAEPSDFAGSAAA